MSIRLYSAFILCALLLQLHFLQQPIFYFYFTSQGKGNKIQSLASKTRWVPTSVTQELNFISFFDVDKSSKSVVFCFEI